jgi:hypothetical protein
MENLLAGILAELIDPSTGTDEAQSVNGQPLVAKLYKQHHDRTALLDNLPYLDLDVDELIVKEEALKAQLAERRRVLEQMLSLPSFNREP